MASVRMVGKDRAQILFRVGEYQYSKTVRVADEREAQRIRGAVEETLRDLERGRLVMPEGADRRAFVFSGGKVTRTATALKEESRAEAVKSVTLGEVFKLYEDTLTVGHKQASSLSTEKIHRKHFLRVVGGKTAMSAIDLNCIQAYVKTRVTTGNGRTAKGVRRDTVEKELATLAIIWKWAFKRGHVPFAQPWDLDDLTLPKGRQKPPFQTWAQIERRIATEGLKGDKADEAWESLYLDQGQTVEFLGWVAENARHPFLHAMVAFAAYTGARRSEIVRSKRSDWDFEGNMVTIHEKKADTSRETTTRTVPIHPELATIMTAWFERAPGIPWTITVPDGKPMSLNMALHYFRRLVAGSKWGVLHGWHTFRHSLASNMASSGVDNRIISDILGHHTEEMARRYQHLLPDKKESVLRGMFGRE